MSREKWLGMVVLGACVFVLILVLRDRWVHRTVTSKSDVFARPSPPSPEAVKGLKETFHIPPNDFQRLQQAETAQPEAKAKEEFEKIFRNSPNTQQNRLRPQESPVNNSILGCEMRCGGIRSCYETGLKLEKEGQNKKAMSSYNCALAQNPEYPEAHDRLGAIQARAEQFDDAFANLRKAVALRPGVALFHRDLGEALKMAGRADEAQVEFAEAERLDH
jgi:tetratricopeptide (TPR) repeat protein